MRFESVSMSPSAGRRSATCRANQSIRYPTLAHQETIEGDDEFGMGRGRDLAVVGNLANVPQALDAAARLRHVAHLVVASRHVRARGCLRRSARGSARARLGVAASDAASAPSDAKSSSVLRHCRTLTGSKEWFSSASTSSGSKGAQRPVVPKVPSRVARPARPAICANSAGGQPAVLVAVELAVGGEGDVIDVEVEPHADRVGGDEVVDVAGLVQRDLRVARARRQRAQHHGRAAALAADQLGDRVDLLGREGDDGRAARQAGDLLLAGEGRAATGAAA